MFTINKKFTLIGIISDTHGLVRSSIWQFLKNCDLIIHAGDVGSIKVLNELGKVAPVVAVRGNTDTDISFNKLPMRKKINLYGVLFYIIHDLSKLKLDFFTTNTVVISGHTHRPNISNKKGIVYINPGSAGYYRKGCPISLSLLSIKDGFVYNPRIIQLPE